MELLLDVLLYFYRMPVEGKSDFRLDVGNHTLPCRAEKLCELAENAKINESLGKRGVPGPLS